jgi:hypothetical protein
MRRPVGRVSRGASSVRVALAVAFLLATSAGCILLVDPNTCAAPDQCPAGQTCVNGSCANGAAPPDGGGTTG